MLIGTRPHLPLTRRFLRRKYYDFWQRKAPPNQALHTDRGRIPVSRDTTPLQRPRRVNCCVLRLRILFARRLQHRSSHKVLDFIARAASQFERGIITEQEFAAYLSDQFAGDSDLQTTNAAK